MADETTTLLINVKVSAEEAIKRQQELKTAIEAQKTALNDLTKDKKGAELAEAKLSEEYIIAESNLKNLNNQLGANQRVLTKMQGDVVGVSGAYAALNQKSAEAAQLAKDMAVAYGSTDVRTIEAAKSAKALSDQLKAVDAATGQHFRNVGDYDGALERFGGRFGGMIQSVQDFTTANGGLSGSFKAGGQAVAGFGKQLLSLLANPIVAIIAAIAGAVMLLVNAMKSNGAATEKFNQILAPFKMMLNSINAVFGKFVSVLLDGVLAIGNLANAVMSLIPGLDKVAERNKEAIRLEREKQSLIRQGIVDKAADAKEELRLADLRKKINQADKYTVEQRLAFAREVDKAEKQLALDDANRANNNLKNFLNNMKMQGKAQKDYTIEELQQLADLQAEKYKQQQAYFDKTRKTASREAALVAEIESEKNAKIEENNAKAEKNREKLEKKKADDLALIKKAEEDHIKQLKENADKAIEILNYEIEMAKLKEQERLAGQKQSDAEIHSNKIATIQRNYSDELSKLNAKLENEQITLADYLKAEELLNQQKNTNIAIENAAFDEAEAQRKEEIKKVQDQKSLEAEQMRLDNEYALAQGDVDRQLQLTTEKLELQKEAEIAAAEGNAALIAEINEKYRIADIDAHLAAQQAKQEAFMKYAEQGMNIASGLNDFVNALGNAELSRFEKQNKGKAGFEEEYAKKKEKLERQAAIRNKALSVMSTVMSTAQSIMAALAIPLGAGVPLAITNAAAGALQIATILATPIPGGGGGSSNTASVSTPSASMSAAASVTGGLVSRSSGQTEQAATTQAMDRALKDNNTTRTVLVTNDLTTALNEKVQLQNDNGL